MKTAAARPGPSQASSRDSRPRLARLASRAVIPPPEAAVRRPV
jgi:hypothetical protein